MVINTNIDAMRGARYLRDSQDMLGKSLARLSSGDKIMQPSDDAAGLAVSEKMMAQKKRLGAAETNVQNAISFVQTAEGQMKSMSRVLTRMSELTMLAKDVTKNAEDIDLYNLEFNSLKDQLRVTIGGRWSPTETVQNPIGTFNGVSLFTPQASGALQVTIGEQAGQTLSIGNINLAAFDASGALQDTAFATLLYKHPTDASYNLSVSSDGARQLMIDAIQQLATERASLGAVQSRLELASQQLTIQQENLEQAISRIRDVDIASETTQYARYQILVQSGTAMLAQANQLPQSVLRLLQ